MNDYSGHARRRWLVHLALIATAAVSLVFEPILLIVHIAAGLAFCTLVLVHLSQRRRVSARLAGRLWRPRGYRQPAARLAWADAFLMVISIAMLASGLWDWI